MADNTNTVAPNQESNPYGAYNSAQALAFPIDLEKQNIWMSFSFYQYQRPVFNTQTMLTDTGMVRLPLPNGMMDSMSVQYQQEAAGSIAGMGLNALSGGKTGTGNMADAGKAAGVGVGISALQRGLNIANPVISASGGNADMSSLLGQLAGVAVNPFMTVLFKQPEFKRHSLSWRLSPSNEAESMALNQIVNTFRYNQLPDLANKAGGTLLTYPNIVQIAISNYSQEFFSYSFKPAVIETLTINFAPSQQPSFFGSTLGPTEVEIRLTLLEIEFWLQRDYGVPSTAGGNVGLDTLTSGAKSVAGGIGSAIGSGLSAITNIF